MTDTTTLSARLRAVSFGGHRQPDDDQTDGRYGERYLHGGLTGAQVAAQAALHFFVYEAIEAKLAEHLERDPDFAFAFPELIRLPAIERDLEHWLGADWRSQIEPTPTTKRYVERIQEVGDQPHLFVAHHYTRYLADLSGGQMIAAMHREAYGLSDRKGAEFYDFPGDREHSGVQERVPGRPRRGRLL